MPLILLINSLTFLFNVLHSAEIIRKLVYNTETNRTEKDHRPRNISCSNAEYLPTSSVYPGYYSLAQEKTELLDTQDVM
jgi:hypothetical protein